MRQIRIIVTIIFIFSCIALVYYQVGIRARRDTTPPVLTIDGRSIEVSVKATEEDLLAGITAQDDRDGNLTDYIVIDSISNFIGDDFRRNINYIVFDSANNTASGQRTIHYTDYEAPKIYSSAPFRYSANGAYMENVLANITAEDCLEGDVSSRVQAYFSGDTTRVREAGDYNITLSVTNSVGDVRTLEVVAQIVDDYSSEYYPMLSDYIIYVKTGSYVNFNKYLTGLRVGNTDLFFDSEEIIATPEDVDIFTASVNLKQPGIYRATYKYGENRSYLYVIVEE